MSKKVSLLLVVLLLLVPLVMTACGGDDKKDDKSADLKQTFESTSGITVKYPDGWAARDGDSGIEIANKAEYFDVEGNAEEVPAGAVVVMVMPPFAPSDMGLADDAAMKDILGMFAQGMGGEGAEVGDVKETKVGSKDAARVSIKDSAIKSDGFVIAFKIDDTHVVIAFVVARDGELSKSESTALKVIESMTYTAPGG
jgi:hypothetical protein